MIAEPIPEGIGPYHVKSVLGSGGFGAVFLCVDPESHSHVAVKLFHSRVEADTARREAAATSKLAVDGVVRLLNQGQEGERAFLVYEYVPGVSLRERLRMGPMAPRDATSLLLQIARTIALAHSQGVLHCDLKPSNVLLRPLESGFQPVVADWGLSRKADGESEHSLSLRGGTLGYAAPEQLIRGRKIGPQADVHALGAMLSEMLGDSGRSIAGDLARIIAACLAPDARQRYANAGRLADDLERWLEGKRPRTVQHARKAPLRWAPITVLAVVVAAVLVRAPTEPRVPVPESSTAIARRDRVSAISEAVLAAEQGRKFLAPDILERSGDPNCFPERLVLAAAGSAIRTHSWNSGGASVVQFRDLRRDQVVTGGPDGVARLWSLSYPPRLLRAFPGHRKGVTALGQEWDQGYLTIGDGAGDVRLWRIDGDEPPKLLGNIGAPVRRLHIRTPQSQLLAGASAKPAKIWDLKTFRLMNSPRTPGSSAVAWTEEGGMWIAGDDGVVHHFPDALSPAPDRSVVVDGGPVVKILLDPATRSCYAACLLGAIALIEENPKTRGRIQPQAGVFAHGRVMDAVVVNKQLRATAHEDGTIRLWNRNGEVVDRVSTGSGRATAVHSPKVGLHWLGAGVDGSVHAWTAYWTEPRVLRDDFRRVGRGSSLGLSPDGRTVLHADRFGVTLLDRESRGESTPWRCDSEPSAIDVSAEGAVVVGQQNGQLTMFRDTTLREPTCIGRYSGSVESARFSPDGGRIAVAFGDRLAVRTRTGPAAETDTGGAATNVRWTSDGRRIYALSGGRPVRWTLDGFCEPVVVRGGDSFTCLAVARDETMVVGDELGTLRFVAADGTTKSLRIGAPLTTIETTPDPDTVVVGTREGSIEFCRMSGEVLLELNTIRAKPVRCMAFSAQGDAIAVLSDDIDDPGSTISVRDAATRRVLRVSNAAK